jgi:hypothetical protein
VGGCGIVLGLALAQGEVTVPLDFPPLPIDGTKLFVTIDGDDANSGLLETSDGKGDGPMRTPQAALRKLREMRARDPSLRDRMSAIALRDGTFPLDAPIEIVPEDSGTPDHPLVIAGRRVTYGFPDHPRFDTTLSGSRPIVGWHAERLLGREAWVADVPDVASTADARPRPWAFRELFVDGERRPRARTPDRGGFAILGVDAADAGRPWNEGACGLRMAPTNLAQFAGGGPAELVLASRWVDSHCRVAWIDAARGTVALRDKTVFKPDPGDLVWIESFAALDQPGEWWLDESAKRVWYLPRESERLESTKFRAPLLESLVRISGNANARVHDIQFLALQFEGAEWWFPTAPDANTGRTSGSPQAAVAVPAAIDVHDAERIDFVGCAVTHSGTYGISLGRACRGVHIKRCWLDDLGAGGVKIGEGALPAAGAECTDNSVDDCHLVDLGRLFPSAVGVWIGQSSGNRIANNVIRDLEYTGVSIGWTWGYGESRAGGNVVEHNEIGFIGAREGGDGPLLSDMGGIYTLGIQDGTLLRANYIHDIAARTYGGWGIYFDEGSTHVEARDNVVLRTTHGGFHQHYGRENHVHHNLFAFGRDAALQRTRPEEHSSFTFDHNVVVAGHAGELFAGDLRDGHFDFHGNVYEIADAAAARFAGGTFAQWQAAGRDHGSIVAPIDLVQEFDADRRPRVPPVWFAPRGSPIWAVLDPEAVSRTGVSIVRDKE